MSHLSTKYADFLGYAFIFIRFFDNRLGTFIASYLYIDVPFCIINTASEYASRIWNLQQKSTGLYKKMLDEKISVGEAIAYFQNEYHSEFKGFRDFRLRDLYLAQFQYLDELEKFRKEHDPLYKAKLEREKFELMEADAREKDGLFSSRETPGSRFFPTLSQVFRHHPDIRTYDTMRFSRKRLSELEKEIQKLESDTSWRKNVETKLQVFENEADARVESLVRRVRQESFSDFLSPLMAALFKYQETHQSADYKAYVEWKRISAQHSWGEGMKYIRVGSPFPQKEDKVRSLSVTDNLIQEMAYLERIIEELEQKELTERNKMLIQFLRLQAVILRIELANMIEFIKEPFKLDLPADEERELEKTFNDQLAADSSKASGF